MRAGVVAVGHVESEELGPNRFANGRRRVNYFVSINDSEEFLLNDFILVDMFDGLDLVAPVTHVSGDDEGGVIWGALCECPENAHAFLCFDYG